jgi:adenine-specific DNA methylase
MIPKECKRLAEVDFPIAVVSKHSAREKSIRHGHPSTLHLWWARRPLAACRAMLLGLLLPDPGDKHCPEDFKQQARDLLSRLLGNVGPKDKDLRKSLLRFIGDFANWDNSNHPTFLEVGRGLVKAAHGEEAPLVVDPFAGGGSIPLEALRLGCEAFASDLNPVACLILKVMLEDIPRYGPELAKELRQVGGEIKKQAEEELAGFYPKDPDGATPIAYLWARTVRCESPNCGAEIPLMRSFWLCKKANRNRALKYKVVRPGGELPHVEFGVFEPKSDREVPGRTVSRAKATCLCCNTVLPPERVRAQLAKQRGGADSFFDAKGNRTGGALLLAVVTLHPGITGRKYRLPTESDYHAVWKAQKRLKTILDEWKSGGRESLCPVPDEPTPAGGGSGAGRAFSVQKYGMLQWGDLFLARQKLTLTTLAREVRARSVTSTKDLLGLAISRLSDYGSAQTTWVPTGEFIRSTFGRHALPIVWDFSEPIPWTESSGNFDGALNWVAHVIESWPGGSIFGQVQVADATQSPLPDQTSTVWFTDPPYYDAIPYSDLSDYFLAWMKRMLPDYPLLRDPFDPSNPLSPKQREAVQDETKEVDGRPKDRIFFEDTMAKAFLEGRRVLKEDGIGSVVFAHKTTEGWEALLSGMIRGGMTITASWPIATERPGRLRSQESAALATSVHLVCRPRPEDAPVGDWGEVLRELPKRVGDWMERLQGEGIRGADLVFACIGPALEIFSRYRMVETAAGREVTLAEYLEKVWEVVGRTALEQVLGTAEAQARNSAAGALEEDARLTALFLWTLQATNGQNGGGRPDEVSEEDSGDEDEDEATPQGKTKGFSLVFDVVRRFAQPLGIELPKWEGRIIETLKGVVRLLAVSERARQLFGKDGAEAVADWIEHDPGKDIQPLLFPEMAEERFPKIHGRRKGIVMHPTLSAEAAGQAGVTTLDRVHAAMLLQAGGQAHALRELIKAEQDRGPDFLRLANALSALYPKGSEEKRLLDAMLLAVPR